MISRCSEARERTVNRSEWSSETTTDDTTAGYRRMPATSIDAMRTVFLVGTPPKGKRGRIVELDAETIALLKAHKQHQSEIKMQNRTRYHDSGLIFSKEWANIRKRPDFLGTPLAKNNWSQREHRQLCEAAGVRSSSSTQRGTALRPCCSWWVRLSRLCRNGWATRRPA